MEGGYNRIRTETCRQIKKLKSGGGQKRRKVMARKLTRDEIETAATMVDDIYRKEGDPEGKDAARELKARMIMCGNTDSDSIYYFEKYARYTWSDL